MTRMTKEQRQDSLQNMVDAIIDGNKKLTKRLLNDRIFDSGTLEKAMEEEAFLDQIDPIVGYKGYGFFFLPRDPIRWSEKYGTKFPEKPGERAAFNKSRIEKPKKWWQL